MGVAHAAVAPAYANYAGYALPPPSWPKLSRCVAAITKYLISVTGLYPSWSVTDRVTCRTCHLYHTDTWGHVSHVSWWLLSLSRCRNTSNVLVTPLQYDILLSYIKTSGNFFVMLNVLFVRYRRELFINKSVPFCCKK